MTVKNTVAEGRPHRPLVVRVAVTLLLLRLPLLVLVVLAHQSHQKLPPEVVVATEPLRLLPPLAAQETVTLFTQGVTVVSAELPDALVLLRLADTLRVRVACAPEPDGLHLPQLRPRVPETVLAAPHVLLALLPLGLQQQELLQ